MHPIKSLFLSYSKFLSLSMLSFISLIVHAVITPSRIILIDLHYLDSSGLVVSSALLVALAFVTFSISLLTRLTNQHKLFSSPFSHPSQLTSPLPPLCLYTYNRAIPLFGCGILYIVSLNLIFLLSNILNPS